MNDPLFKLLESLLREMESSALETEKNNFYVEVSKLRIKEIKKALKQARAQQEKE